MHRFYYQFLSTLFWWKRGPNCVKTHTVKESDKYIIYRDYFGFSVLFIQCSLALFSENSKGRQASMQAVRQAAWHAVRQIGRQVGRQAVRQNRQIGRQTSRQKSFLWCNTSKCRKSRDCTPVHLHLEYSWVEYKLSTRVVEEGDRRSKKTTLIDTVHLASLDPGMCVLNAIIWHISHACALDSDIVFDVTVLLCVTFHHAQLAYE